MYKPGVVTARQNEREAPAQLKIEENFEGQSMAAPEFGLHVGAIPPPPPDEAKPQERSPFQLKRNDTGLPDDLKSGVEHLSGQSLDDVRVQFNSPQPAQMQAHAFARGSEIHVAPGQEQHLPEEAWHVTQQKEGRVQANTQINGQPVNDNEGLESEARNMGAKAAQMKADPAQLHAEGFQPGQSQRGSLGQGVTQRAGDDPLDIFTLIMYALIFILGLTVLGGIGRRRLRNRVAQEPNVQQKAQEIIGSSGSDSQEKEKGGEDVSSVDEVPIEHKDKAEKLGNDIQSDVQKAVVEVKASDNGKQKKEDKPVSEPEKKADDLEEKESKEDLSSDEENEVVNKEEEEIVDEFGFTPGGTNYREHILTNRNWGGHLEAHAMAEGIGIRTAIYYNQGGNLVRLAEIGPGNGTQLEFSLFWTGDHYQVIEQDCGVARVNNWNGNIFYNPPGNGNCLYTAFAYLSEVHTCILNDPQRANNLNALQDRYANDLDEQSLDNKAKGMRELAYRNINPMLANLAGAEGLGGEKKARKDVGNEQSILQTALLASIIYEVLPYKDWKIEEKKKTFKFVNRKDPNDNQSAVNKLGAVLDNVELEDQLAKIGDSSFLKKGKVQKKQLEMLAHFLGQDPNYNDELRDQLEKKAAEERKAKKKQSSSRKKFDEDLSFDVTLNGFPLRFVVEQGLLNAMIHDGVPVEELEDIHWSKSTGKGEWNIIKPRSGDKSKAFELKVWGGQGKSGDYGCDRWRSKPGDYDKDPKNKKVRQVLTFSTSTQFNEK